MGFSLAAVLFFSSINYEEPWVAEPLQTTQIAQPSPLSQVSQGLIGFYRTYLTQTTGPRSHFRPSSSLYMLEAIQKHGFWKGYFMGCDRLMRENSEAWVYRPILDEEKRFKADPP